MSFFFLFPQLLELTPETAPASHVAGSAMRQDFTRCGETGRLDGIGGHDRGGQLDQGNVVAVTLKKNNNAALRRRTAHNNHLAFKRGKKCSMPTGYSRGPSSRGR